MEAKDRNDTLAQRMLALNQVLLAQYMNGLRNDNPRVRRKSVRGLASLGSLAEGAIPTLELLLKDKDRKVREAVAEALKSIRSEP